MLRGPLGFLGTAAICGIIFHTVFFAFQQSNTTLPSTSHLQPSFREDNPSAYSQESCTAPPSTSIKYVTVTADAAAPTATVFKDPWVRVNDMTLEEIREMVSKTKGLFARDFSLGLGWNNMRFILEAALLHATLLNRTLVIPSFVYSRSCEFDILTCASFAKMVNRGEAVGSKEWQNLPLERQVAWRIPIEIMLDIPRLRKKYPVILVSEYLKMQGLPTDYEWANGMWHREVYHSGPHPPSLHIISNRNWDPQGVIRVDRRKKIKGILTEEGRRLTALLEKKRVPGDKPVLDWSEARSALSAPEGIPDDQFERLLHEAGWTTLYTWDGSTYNKAVVEPSRQVAPVQELRGVVNDWNHIRTDVLLLEGEIHLYRKAGFLRFTTPEARDAFSEMVLESFRPAERIMELARKISDRMTEVNGGRQWMGAHMRRGDFVDKGWVMEQTLEAHVSRVQRNLERGRKTLQEMKDSGPKAYNIPNAHINHVIHERAPPLANDTIFIATDEQNSTALEYIREHGALLFYDLCTVQDRREFGWPIMLFLRASSQFGTRWGSKPESYLWNGPPNCACRCTI